MKRICLSCLLLLLAVPCAVRAQQTSEYPVSGRVIDRLTRQPVAYASVVVQGEEQRGASTDSTGRFVIERVRPGIQRFVAPRSDTRAMSAPSSSFRPPRPSWRSSSRRMPRRSRP